METSTVSIEKNSTASLQPSFSNDDSEDNACDPQPDPNYNTDEARGHDSGIDSGSDDDNDDDQEWEIQKILDSWYNDGLLQYQIHWKGYNIKDATWEPAENCKGSTTALRKFHHSNPNKPH